MYHMCVAEATGTFKKFSFLCPNGTVFNQEKLVCDAWFNVDCSEAGGYFVKKIVFLRRKLL